MCDRWQSEMIFDEIQRYAQGQPPLLGMGRALNNPIKKAQAIGPVLFSIAR